MDSSAAILLRRTKLSETSFIITWLTQDHGLIKTVAKGARRPKSPFAGRLDLFFEADIQFVRSRRSELHTLGELLLHSTHDALRQSYLRLELAAHFVELIELTSVADHPIPEIFDLLRRALGFLDAQEPTRRALLHFERELARALGLVDDTNADPIRAIARLTHRLPMGRADLLKRLRAKDSVIASSVAAAGNPPAATLD
jgi:DNA repair protein RecO (recombination protein O)